MTDSCCKLFKLKCFRKLSNSSTGSEKNCTSSSLVQSSCGGVEKDKKNHAQEISSTSIDKEKKVVCDDETQVLLRRHQHAYLFRSVSETTSNGDAMWSDDDYTDEDESHDVLSPLVDEINRLTKTDDEMESRLNSKKLRLREFPQMKSRLEMNLFEKLFRTKFERKVNVFLSGNLSHH